MVALTSHSSSRADPTRRAVMRIPTLVQRVFGSDTVWRDHSFTSLVSAHAAQVWHGDVRSPCHKRSASSDEQRVDLGLCQTQDAIAHKKPVGRPVKKGYASHPLCELSLRSRVQLYVYPCMRLCVMAYGYA